MLLFWVVSLNWLLWIIKHYNTGLTRDSEGDGGSSPVVVLLVDVSRVW